MTAAAQPETIPTTQGNRLCRCPYCGHRVAVTESGSIFYEFDGYWCSYCEAEGWVLDLPDVPELPEDDTHAIYGDIGPVIPPTLFRRPHDPRIGAALRSAGRDALDETFVHDARLEIQYAMLDHMMTNGMPMSARALMTGGQRKCHGDGMTPCYGIRDYCPDHG